MYLTKIAEIANPRLHIILLSRVSLASRERHWESFRSDSL